MSPRRASIRSYLALLTLVAVLPALALIVHGGLRQRDEAIAQAQAAASRAVTVLTSTKLQVGGQVAEIFQNRCTGCNVCVTVCPYQAITLDDKNKAVVNEALCKGCGTCVASCRSGAPQLRGFTNAGIFAQIAACF